MGQFSWITQDTRRSILSVEDRRFEVRMYDDAGHVWVERAYDGYGVFGGKDFYVLLSEMNGGDGTRGSGIGIAYGDEPYRSPNLVESDEWKWSWRAPQDCPEQGWCDWREGMRR